MGLFGRSWQIIPAISAFALVLLFCQMQTSYQDSAANASNQVTAKVGTPLAQYESGIAIKNIRCNDGLQLALRSENGYPVCISPSTQEKLASREFIMPLATVLSKPVLMQSISYGPSPLTIGFYLTYNDIYTIKNWNFGDNKTDNSTYSIIENHVYSLPHKSDTKWKFTGHVYVMDQWNKHPQYNVTFTVMVIKKESKPYISNLGQYEGVLYQDDADGFDVSTNNTELPSYQWNWGDGNFETGRKYDNPFYAYASPNNYTGNVTLTPAGLTNPQDIWPFGVLILDKSTPRPTRIYDDVYPTDKDPAVGIDQFRAGQKLCFYFSTDNNNDTSKKFVPESGGLCGLANPPRITSKLSDPATIKSTTWSFGNVTIPFNGSDELIPTHTFENSGTYDVNCTVRYTDNTNVTLSKTVSILPKDRTLFLTPDHGKDGDTIYVNGSYYGPEYKTYITLHVGNDDKSEGSFPVSKITKMFSGSFTLNSYAASGLKTIRAEDSFGHDLADANFTIK